VRIGVNTGPIFAGDVGGQVIREFAVMGDAVNVAARIKDLAPPGCVYVGAGTADAAGGAFALRALGEVVAKGRQRRLRPFELLRDRGRRRAGADVPAFSGLVGRARERAALEECIAGLRRGRGGVVFVEGAAGIGKSRLVAELARSHPDLGFDELQAGRLAAESPALSGDAPAVVVVEGVERADDTALAVLGGWIAGCVEQPLLVVLVGRPNPGIARLRARARALGIGWLALPLDPLAAAEAEALVDSLAGGEPLPAATRALVLERGEGNPSKLVQAFFLSAALEADAARSIEQPQRSEEEERRRATVLFADLTGFTGLAETIDPRTLHTLVSDCLERLSAIARRWGGSVEKHLGDCILATFGFPRALEGAPRAAVNAAIEMRAEVAAFSRERALARPFAIHTGIDTGLGIAGEVSGPLIREFALMGDSVGGAARLEEASPPGAIYVGSETRRATAHEFDYRPLRLEDGGEAFELLSREPRAHRAPVARRRGVFSELVGRGAELEALGRALTALASGCGGAVAVVGDAGLGKSRLVAEARQRAPGGVLWLEGRSLPVGRRLPYHPFADLLARWCGVEETDDDAAVLARLETAAGAELGDAAAEGVPFLATLMAVAPPERERPRLARLGGEAMERLIRSSVAEVVRRVAERRPLVLCFEDLHWADLSSVELLVSLLHLAGSERLLLLFACRPHYAETSERVLAGARERLGARNQELRLAPLDADAARTMLRNLFRGAEVPYEVRSAIEERAQGNPFFVEEVVRSLLDAGALVERGGVLETTARIRGFEVPGSLQEVIMTRVDRLDRERRNVLRVASAIGPNVPLEVLSAVAGRERLPELVVGLVEAEMLVPSERRPGELSWRHPLIQGVVYDSIVAARREQLHRAIGRAIEERLAEGTPGYAAMLALHYTRGGELERAEDYLLRAGEEAARAAASDEALEFFQEAARLYRQRRGEQVDPARLAVLERHIALALVNRARHGEAIEHFDEALRLRGVAVTKQPVALGLRFARDLALVLARLYLPGARRGRPPASELQRAVQELIYERARAQTTVAPARYLFDWIDGLRRLDRADPRTMPLAGGQYASTIGIFSYGGVSFAVSERFLRIAREIVDPDDPGERMIFGFMNFFHHFLAGDWSEAHELPEDLVDERIRNGQLFDVTNYLTFHVLKRNCQGRFEAAEGGRRRMQEIADRFQYDLALSALRAERMFRLLEQERFEESAREAELYYEGHADPLLNVLALGTKAKAQLLGGDRDGASRSLGAAEHLLSSATGVVPAYHRSAVLRSRLLYEVDALERNRGDAHPARRAARAALRAAAKVACRRPEVYRLEGTRRWLARDPRGARRWWERAAASARSLGMAPELGRIEAERARCGEAGSSSEAPHRAGAGHPLDAAGHEREEPDRCLSAPPQAPRAPHPR
jgi:class 3 adenylate cyclase